MKIHIVLFCCVFSLLASTQLKAQQSQRTVSKKRNTQFLDKHPKLDPSKSRAILLKRQIEAKQNSDRRLKMDKELRAIDSRNRNEDRRN